MIVCDFCNAPLGQSRDLISVPLGNAGNKISFHACSSCERKAWDAVITAINKLKTKYFATQEASARNDKQG